MKLVNDFFNELATEIRSTYFPNVAYYRDNKQCATASYAIELMINGCLSYSKLINRLSKACRHTHENINAVVAPFVKDWAGYEYIRSEKEIKSDEDRLVIVRDEGNIVSIYHYTDILPFYTVPSVKGAEVFCKKRGFVIHAIYEAEETGK